MTNDLSLSLSFNPPLFDILVLGFLEESKEQAQNQVTNENHIEVTNEEHVEETNEEHIQETNETNEEPIEDTSILGGGKRKQAKVSREKSISIVVESSMGRPQTSRKPTTRSTGESLLSQ